VTSQPAINESKGQKVSCVCRECRRSTNHEIVADATFRGSSENYAYHVNWTIEHQIIKCLGCESISFRRAEGNDQDCLVKIGPDEWEYQPQEDLYPSPYEGRQPLSDAALLPDKIQRIYQETLKALNAAQKVLCGIGVRAIVETVCKDRNASGSELFAKINSLVDLGVLTADGASILHKLRTLGNDAAHEVKPHTPEELGLAFDVVDHLLLGVYILPEHAKRMFK
jgi:Domain of unknown function (DUF4145)